MVVRSAANPRLQRVGVRRGVAKVGHKWGKFGNAGTDRIPIRGAPDENHFTGLRAGEMVYTGCRVWEVKRRFRIKAHHQLHREPNRNRWHQEGRIVNSFDLNCVGHETSIVGFCS